MILNFSYKIFLPIISIIAIISVTSLLFFQLNTNEVSSYQGPQKAAIIDQLYNEFPNERFQEQSQQYLESVGYEVDIFTTDQITVDFYKNLPKLNYKYIIIRTHGVSQEGNNNSVGLFTGEKYNEEKYISEQLFGHLKKGAALLDLLFAPDYDQSEGWTRINSTHYELKSSAVLIDRTKDEYFVISSSFVNDVMAGNFDKTIFILGGCDTLSDPSFANSLIKRGASVVVGWEDQVGASTNDQMILKLLDDTLVQNIDLDDSLDSVMKTFSRAEPLPKITYQTRIV